jgi:hypothetical protein
MMAWDFHAAALLAVEQQEQQPVHASCTAQWIASKQRSLDVSASQQCCAYCQALFRPQPMLQWYVRGEGRAGFGWFTAHAGLV